MPLFVQFHRQTSVITDNAEQIVADCPVMLTLGRILLECAISAQLDDAMIVPDAMVDKRLAVEPVDIRTIRGRSW